MEMCVDKNNQMHISMKAHPAGSSEYYAACDTQQFKDYSKFAAGTFNEEHKRKMRKEQFPKDLQAAYDIGSRLITEGGGSRT